jgi:hypothetical protein
MSEEAVLEVGQADAMAFGETFKRIEQAWRPYRTVVRRAQAGPGDETPASFCARLLEELEPVLGGGDEAI